MMMMKTILMKQKKLTRKRWKNKMQQNLVMIRHLKVRDCVVNPLRVKKRIRWLQKRLRSIISYYQECRELQNAVLYSLLSTVC